MKKAQIFIFISFIIIFTVCFVNNKSSNSTNENSKATKTKIKKNNIKKEIFNQVVWMTQNLNVDSFRNGELIPYIESKEEWKIAGENKQPAWWYYNNDSANDNKFGKLYNWYAVNDSRGLAPNGWHIPSKNDWKEYIKYIGKEYNSDLREYRNVAGRKMKSNEGWEIDCNGTNESGFSGYPCWLRSHFGKFGHIGTTGFWWSSSEFDNQKAWLYSQFDHDNEVVEIDDFKAYGFSVRCIKD